MAGPFVSEPFKRAQVEESLQPKEFFLKKTILACTCALLLSSGNVFAQMQPAPGGAAHGDVGPGVNKGKTTKSIKMEKGTTTGTGKMKAGSQSSANPSSSGNVGPGTNNNAGPQPGGR
jgi:hypothetical protein